MRFHVPSFLHYMESNLPSDSMLVHHHYICYVMSALPLRMDFLKESILDAVLLTFEKPIGTLDSAEQRSVIEGLTDEHWEILRKALSEKNTYLKKAREKKRNRGEVIHEYQINLRLIMKILREVRLSHDCGLIQELIQNEVFTIDGKRFISLRKLEKLIFYHTGKAFSIRRIDEALHELQRQKVVNGPNGFRYRYGREVRV